MMVLRVMVNIVEGVDALCMHVSIIIAVSTN